MRSINDNTRNEKRTEQRGRATQGNNLKTNCSDQGSLAWEDSERSQILVFYLRSDCVLRLSVKTAALLIQALNGLDH